MRIRVAIADWQMLFVDGLEAMLRGHQGLEIAGKATEADELLQMISVQKPDVVVLSRILPARNGLSVIRAIRQFPAAPAIILLAAEISESEVAEAIALGVSAVMMKTACSSDKLRQCIRSVATGGRWYEPAGAKAPHPSELSRLPLSSREVDVARAVAVGMRNREIAEQLFIAESTVKVHLKKIYEKVKVHNRVALTVYAREHGLL